jgi:CRP/FNR family transcriptional regulator, polysaccharide utilization system transcription regulator
VNQNILNRKGCSSCKDKAEIFNGLCQAELDLIDDKRIEVHFKAGELIFKQGTPNLHFLCLTQGKVKTYIEGYNDKNLILGIVKPIEYILGPGIYSDHMHHFSAMAIEDSMACLVDLTTFRHLIRNNPDFAEDFLKKASLQSIDNYELFISLTQKQMPGRIADVLLYLKDKIYESNPFTTTLSRQDLADMSGMSKESSIRILREFKDEGIIQVNGNQFEILNVDQLVKISQTG